MKKRIVVLIALALAAGAALVTAALLSRDTRKSNDSAEKDTAGRYLTVVNRTDQIINRVYVSVGDGSQIEDMQQTNPDEESFSIPIPGQYSGYTDFTVTLVDRYDMKYVRQVTGVPSTGRTEVVITGDDYVRSRGDTWSWVERLLNGD